MSNKLLSGLLAGAVTLPVSVLAADAPDVAELQRMIADMQQTYEARISALEARVQQAEAKAAADQAVPLPPPPAPVQPVSQGGAGAFNPAISLVVQGSAAAYRQDPGSWTLPGFQLGGEAGLKSEGLSLTETELTASANVDDWFYGQATIGLHEEDGATAVELEEAFVDSLSLPGGLGLRAGRFYAETGYINTRHTHAWDFADAPLTSQAFLGKQYGDDGVRMTWLAPTDTFIELGAELLRGGAFPGGGDEGRLLGDTHNLFVRIGNDIGRDQSYRIGLSHLRTSPTDRGAGHAHAGHADETFSFAGDSALTALDLVYKWQPAGGRGLVLQGEYFHRDEDGLVSFSNDVGGALLPYSGTQQGFYLQGVYEIRPRWRMGLRYDQLWSDNSLAVTGNTSGEADADLLDESGLLSGYDPYRWTLMADYSRSDFSRLRLQYARDYTRPGLADDQFQLQYIMSLGAHGAHQY